MENSRFLIARILFSAGDGSTTFNIPDMRDRVAAGASSSVALGTYQSDATAVNGLNGTLPANAMRYTDIVTGNDGTIIGKGVRIGLRASAGGMSSGNGATTSTFATTSYLQTFQVGEHPAKALTLSSTDSETRMKNGRINYIIKF